MFTIRTHFNGWGVFHPDWCDGRTPVFGGAGCDIFDCLAYMRQAESEGH